MDLQVYPTVEASIPGCVSGGCGERTLGDVEGGGDSVVVACEERESLEENEETNWRENEEDEEGASTSGRVLLGRIEKTVLDILHALSEGRLPVLEHNRVENSLELSENLGLVGGDDGQEIPGEIQVRSSEEVVGKELAKSKIKFQSKPSQKKFTLIVNLMSKVYCMVIKGESCTKRDLYYEDVQLYGTQARLEQGLQDMCMILKVPRSAIPVKATAKGLVAGDLVYTDVSGVDVDVSVSRSGLLVPNMDEGVSNIRSKAKFILLVEKDAIFQRFLGEDIFETQEPMIMITGKGYPDFGTRKFIQTLSTELKIPVMAFVDCDPHGIEIAAIVKWGSYGQANLARCTDEAYAQELIVPDLVWAGLLPSDIDGLNLRKASTEMNLKDEKKLESVKIRLSGQPNGLDWCSEIDILKSLKVKTELESLFNYGSRFATQTYLKRKVDELLNKDEKL